MRGESLPRPAAISLVVGEPVPPSGSDLADLVRLRDRVADAIAADCGEPRLDLVAGGPERPCAAAADTSTNGSGEAPPDGATAGRS
jgi:hypothetical protein